MGRAGRDRDVREKGTGWAQGGHGAGNVRGVGTGWAGLGGARNVRGVGTVLNRRLKQSQNAESRAQSGTLNQLEQEIETTPKCSELSPK